MLLLLTACSSEPSPPGEAPPGEEGGWPGVAPGAAEIEREGPHDDTADTAPAVDTGSSPAPEQVWVDYEEVPPCPAGAPPERLVCYTFAPYDGALALARIEPAAGLEAYVAALDGDACSDVGVTLILDEGRPWTCTSSALLVGWDLSTGAREVTASNCVGIAPHPLGLALHFDDGSPDELHVYPDLDAAKVEAGLRRVVLDRDVSFDAFDVRDDEAVGADWTDADLLRFDAREGVALAETPMDGLDGFIDGVAIAGDEVLVLADGGGAADVLWAFEAATGAERWRMPLVGGHSALRCGCLPGSADDARARSSR